MPTCGKLIIIYVIYYFIFTIQLQIYETEIKKLCF